jgi:hypothetical protein
VKQQRHNIARVTISEHLINELPKGRITQQRPLYSLLTKLGEFREKKLLR